MLELEDVKELGRICWAWVKREGPLSELMLAWLEVTTGAVLADEKDRQTAVTA